MEKKLGTVIFHTYTFLSDEGAPLVEINGNSQNMNGSEKKSSLCETSFTNSPANARAHAGQQERKPSTLAPPLKVVGARTSVINGSFRQRAKTAAQRRLLSAAQSREANMAVILISTVSMFLICLLPRMFIVV